MIKKGTKVIYTPTGMTFELAKVTDTRVSWYNEFEYKGGNGINNLKMTCITLKRFNKGVDNGTYKIIE